MSSDIVWHHWTLTLPIDSDPRQNYVEQVVIKLKNLSMLQPVQILCHQDIMPIKALDQDLESIIGQAYQNVNLENPVAIICQMITNRKCHSHYYFLSNYSLETNIFIIIASFTCLIMYHYVFRYLRNLITNSWQDTLEFLGPMRFSNIYTTGLKYWIQCISTSGTVTHTQEPSPQEINKQNCFQFLYFYSHKKAFLWTLS